MRKLIYLTAIVIAVCAGSAQNTNAQHTQFTANIPFDFHVGGDRFPAGEYTVRCVNPSSDLKVLQLRKTDADASVMLQTIGIVGQANQQARLVFNRYGNQYYLAQAWLSSERIGMQAIKSRRERATAKEMARLAYKPETLALAIKR